jgi:hypothetical protein
VYTNIAEIRASSGVSRLWKGNARSRSCGEIIPMSSLLPQPTKIPARYSGEECVVYQLEIPYDMHDPSYNSAETLAQPLGPSHTILLLVVPDESKL